MSYTPPTYPSTIPSQTGADPDLPDRVDDVDWFYAARYNELKKELLAVMAELGTLPKGTFGSVKTRLDDIYPQFHDRGDPAANDWIKTDLSLDGAWHDLALSAIVPDGATSVLFRVDVKDDTIGSAVLLRKNGNSNALCVASLLVFVADQTMSNDVIVACDSSRVIEYWATNKSWDSVNLVVKGWWK